MTTLVGNVHPEFRAFWHPVAWSQEVAAAPDGGDAARRAAGR